MSTPSSHLTERPDPVKILVVEAAPASRARLVAMLEADPRLHVLAAMADPSAALRFMQKTPVDVVLMDRDAPGRDGGFEATKRIMQTQPMPVVLCTPDGAAATTTTRALEAGAVACIDKPLPDDTLHATRAAHMRLTLRLMSEVRVVGRRARAAAHPPDTQPLPPATRARIIGIGASTGGPAALQIILSGLSGKLGVPVLVVQHVAAGFLPGLAAWLSQSCGLPVHVGANGMSVQPGHVYLAPDGQQMGIDAAGCIVARACPDDGGELQPSVAFLFRSLAETYGARAVGVLLSGMGKDGAADLKRMRDLGATTIAQDSESSAVHGMPGEAIALGGASLVLPAHRIAQALLTLVQARRGAERN